MTDLKIGVLYYGAISGTVRDDAGDPVVGMAIAAFQRSATPGRAGFRGTTRTDDRGEYVMENLPPGEYLVCACGSSALPLDGTVLTTLAAQPLLLLAAAGRAAKVGSGAVQLDGTLRTYAPAFHPGSRVSSRADRVVLTSGLRRQGVDVTVTAVRMARVSGRVTGATGPMRANEIRLRPVDEDPSTPVPDIPAMLVQPDGRFDFANVPPGEYRVHVNHVPRTGAGAPSGTALALLGARGTQMNADASLGSASADAIPEWGLANISVGDSDVTDLVVPVQPAATVRGRVEFIGSTPAPAADRIARMNAMMESIAPYSGEQTFLLAPVRLAADGSFILRGASPSLYLARAGATAPWITVASVTVDGRDITDLPLEITGTDVRNLTITMSDAVQATAEGRVVGAAAPGAAGPLAVIFPADRKQWTHPAASRRFGSFPVDQKGNFTIIAPEGDYFVATIADVYGVVWRDAERLEALARSATRVTLVPGTNPQIEVRR